MRTSMLATAAGTAVAAALTIGLVATSGASAAPQPTAPKGAAAAGSIGIDSVTTGTAVSIGAGSSGTALVNCPAGRIVSGGGAGTSGYNIVLLDTRPEGNGWRVYGKNLGSGTESITPYVVCLAISLS